MKRVYSNVHIAGLDISKAFDGVNHYVIFVKLINVNIPLFVLNALINWNGKLSANVRWAGVLLKQFGVRSGVGEGSIISPLIFSPYINDIVNLLKSEGYGCYLGNVHVGCLSFADDIMLLSASVRQLQCMLKVCYQYCFKWDLQFNAKKSSKYLGTFCCHINDLEFRYI